MSHEDSLQAECATHGGKNHQHSHHQCKCYERPPVGGMLVQSIQEVEFDNGIWGIISRGAPHEKVAQFLAKQNSYEKRREWASRKDASGYSPLHYAARRRDGSIEITGMLLDLGADPNVQTQATLMTPLHRAAACRNIAICEMLLKAGAKKETADSRGLTAYDWVVKNEFPQMSNARSPEEDERARETLLRMLKPQEEASVGGDPAAEVVVE